MELIIKHIILFLDWNEVINISNTVTVYNIKITFSLSNRLNRLE